MAVREKVLRSLVAEQAACWHVMLAEDEVSREHTREFVRWLRASPIHVEEYLRIADIAAGLVQAARADTSPLQGFLGHEATCVVPLQPEAATAKVEPASSRGAASKSTVRRKGQRAHRWVFRAAAAALVAALLLSPWQRDRTPSSIETFAATGNQEKDVWLPDHTRVQIGANSSITIVFTEEQRKVLLDRGRAYFDVAKDAARPFSVRAGNSIIRDIGTAFAVDMQGQGTTVTVAQGRVKLWDSRMIALSGSSGLGLDPDQQEPGVAPVADLVAGEQAHVDASGQLASLRTVDVRKALAWTVEQIRFDNQTIADVASRLNSYNRLQITVTDQNIGDRHISGVIGSHDVSAFVAFVRGLPGVGVKKRGEQVIVYAK